MQGVFGLLALFFEQRRPHAERKLVDTHPEELGKKEMAELMDEDDQPEKENGDQKRPGFLPDRTERDEEG